MIKLLLTSFLLTTSLAFAQQDKFVQFPERTATAAEWFQPTYQDTSFNKFITVDAFEMGNQITWKQYKAFLSDVKRMKGEFGNGKSPTMKILTGSFKRMTIRFSKYQHSIQK